MKPGTSGGGGGGPRWENIGLIAFLTGALGFSMVQDWKPNSEEVTYMDFINLYLAKNRCKQITIAESKESDMYQFVAYVDLHEGGTVHLVLP